MSMPRARFADLVRREEATRTGIYILIGVDPERINGLKVYIGEADVVGKRLRHHDSKEEMDFFDRVAFVVSKDENLNQGACPVSGEPVGSSGQGGRVREGRKCYRT